MSEILQSVCIVYFDGDEYELKLYSKHIQNIYNLLVGIYSTVYTLGSPRNKQDVSPNIYNILIHFNGLSTGKLQKGYKNFENEHKKNLHVDYLSYKYDHPIDSINSDCLSLLNKYFSDIKSVTPMSVAVFDFDDTIVDENQKLFYPSILNDIELYKTVFNYIILWTHGSTDYIQYEMKNKSKLSKLFDIVIAKQRDFEYGENKGKGAILKLLNKEFKITQISYSLLVDDKNSNYMNDYTYFIQPTKIPEKFYRKQLENIKKEIILNNKNVIL